jgi:hypothetical protein
VKSEEAARLRARGGRNEALPLAAGLHSFQTVGGAPPVWSAGECFAVCGARLKELFEKSSLRNLKNFPVAVVFCHSLFFLSNKKTTACFRKRLLFIGY